MTNTATNLDQRLIEITNQFVQELGNRYHKEIKLNIPLLEYGIDSIGRAELFRRFEKEFNVIIPDRLVASAETLNDIKAYLATAAPGSKKIESPELIISHGEHVKVDPSKAKTLLEVLWLYGEKAPKQAHIYFQTEEGKEEIITYGQLLNTSLAVAQSFHEKGLKKGETVAIMQPTNPGFFYTFFGTLLAGGIPVPIYPPFRAHMLEAYAKTEARILNNAEVRILVTFEEAEKLSYLLKAFIPSLRAVMMVKDLLNAPPIKKPFSAHADDIAFIQYTSGSTSDPKGVVLTHRNLLANIHAYSKAIQVTTDDVAVSWLPLYHDMGLIGMWLGSLYFGIPLVLLTPFSFLNKPERWLWAIHHHRGTHSGAPNFAYELCVRKIEPAVIEGLNLSSWRMAANGAEKVYPRTLEQFAEKFAPYGFKREALTPVYGLAESTVALTIPPIGREFKVDHVERKKFEEERIAEPSTEKNALSFVGCGFPIEGHEVRIVDDEDNVLPERQVGTLQFRGPSSMQGYYHNVTATQAAFHDDWIDSGDLAYLVDGEIFITGRRKDLIIKAGRNLYPAEIEELVGNVEGVRQGCVAAFGIVDNERGTEQLIVVAETRETNKSARHEIMNIINEVISTALDIVPDEIVLVAPRVVPKTSSGKLQRAACKNMYLEGRLGKKQLPAWLQVIKLAAEWTTRKCWNGMKWVGSFIYTLYFYIVVGIGLIPLFLIVQFSSRETAATVCQWAAKILIKLIFIPLKINGREYLEQAQNDKSAKIFVANHASYIDTLILISLLPKDTRFVGKKELLRVPVIGTFMRKLEYISIDRTDLPKGLEDTQYMENILREGYSLLIFPEGTFGYASGLRPFRLGAFKIAIETQTTMYPIALQGTRRILRAEEKLLHPRRVTVTMIEPIKPQGTEWQDVIELRNKVHAEIAEYCGEPSLDLISAQTVAPRRSV